MNPPTSTSTGTRFPADFVWGAATASYQIEGAVDADGRTTSIWDTFARVPGAVIDGDTGDVACDHYHRYPTDVALIKELGFGAYRFSVAWPRVRPDGGAPNPAGIAFYDRLVDELLGAGVAPWLTLYHWDLPQALEDAGGWTDRDTTDRFVDYALTLYDALGDRVDRWTTLNEPWCSAFLGYTGGQHAPGRQEGIAGIVAAHHLMLAHGKATAALRERMGARSAGAGGDQEVGITLNLTVPEPFDPSRPGDVEAAADVDTFWNRMFLDPIFTGTYEPRLAERTEGRTWQGSKWQEFVRDGDLEVISAPLDFLGVNYYHGDAPSTAEHTPEDLVDTRGRRPDRPTVSPYPAGVPMSFPRRGLPTTGQDWEIQPDGLRVLLQRLRDDYLAPLADRQQVPPIYITENGAAFPDDTVVDGRVDDADRCDFFEGHLRATAAAIDAGVDVRGYFAWSLLDNFEWAYGYGQRFGIVHVDYETQVRTPKSSALWFSAVIGAGGLPGVAPGVD
ncbi:GH1 family beta-glucosidase [Nocardioides sambongensis]|uniref:GH1 family beta-glucosidase n=1 Tax=Nocardioides sambongensis TaxID=2589074 RepID=UPI00112DB9FD|nr:GH1 family beta-glucosidase [Nocardioides sambongensis]